MKQFLLFVIGLFAFLQHGKSQVSYTWNGSASTAWNNASNWTPNSGIPGAADNVTIVTGSNVCQLSANTSITNITLTSGTLNMNGFVLTSTGNAVFTAGTVTNGTLTVNAGTGNTATLSNTAFSTSGVLNITTGAITLNGGVYGAAVTFNQTGATQTTGTGGATFNSTLSITNSGSNNFRINGNCTYNGATIFNNSGSGYFLPELTTGSTYSGNLTLNNTSATQNIRMAYLGTTSFNKNIILNNTGGGNFTFCEQSSATATLASGQTISVGGSGFNIGTLTLSKFTQLGNTAQNITLTGSATATFNNSTTFNGALTLSSPNIYISNCTYNGVTVLTKTDGTNTNQTAGGNTFNNTLTINYIAGSGAGSWFGFANGAADIYNGDVYVNNNSFDRILWGVTASSNTQFNGNLIVTQIGSSLGIATAWNAASTCVMAAGKTISVGAAGFNCGYLYIQGLTQNGNAAINITTTGTSSVYMGQGAAVGPCTIGGSLNITAPDIYLRGGTFNGAVSVTKTGGTNNHNNSQQNIFNSTCTINQQSNGGYFMLGYNSNDLFNGNITVTSTGTGGINLGYSSGTGTPTLVSGSTILVGSAGFSAGFLSFGAFTQLGNAAMNLTFTGASTSLTFAFNSVIGGNLTANVPDVYFNGSTFNGMVNCTKTGGNNDAGSGGNTFQSTSNFTNTGAGYLMFGNGTADKWNGDVTFTNSGAERILPCWNSAGNQFNGNVIVSNIGSGVGIEFCGGSTASTCTLAATKNIQIAPATGYNTGYLHLYRFTQLGTASSNLTLTGAATVITIGPSAAIGGNFTVVSPRILLNGAVYSDTVNLTKTGSTGEWSVGGNTFNSLTTINQLGSGYFGFANGAPDIYNGDLYANNNSTERIIFGNTPTGNQFNGNIILTQIGSSVGIAFGWNATTNETMAAGKTISIGAAGFNVGYLQIAQFTQLGSTAMNLPLTGTASLTFGPSSSIGGNLTSTSATLLFNGCTFSGTVNSTKNGTTNDASTGSNIFNGASVFTNNGSGQLFFGNGSSDQFNAASTFNNTGSNNIYVAWNSSNNVFGGTATFNNTPTANTGIYVSWNSAGTIFNNNIVVTSNNGIGVQFCGGNTTATATLSAGNTITTGAGGFSAGTLLLQQFTQVGNTSQALILTGSGILNVGPSSAFGGNVNFLTPQLGLNGCTYSGTAILEQNGSTNSSGTGGNIFNGTTTITNSGSAQFLTGNTNADQFNGATTFNNTGAYRFYFAYNHAGQTTTFANTLTLNSAKTGGSDGWSFMIGEGSNVNVSYAGTVTMNCSGALASNFRIAQGTGSMATYNGDLILNLTNTNSSTQYQMGATGTSVYNGNLVVNNTGGASGIYFNVGSTATSTLANTKTITVGSGGFNSGLLSLIRFTQLGGTAQALTLTGSGVLNVGPSSAFGGNVNFLSPQLNLNGCTYSGTATLEQNGSTNSSGTGGNIFNGTTIITNSGSAQFLTGNTNADQFNAVTTFNNTGAYRFCFANNHTSQTTTFAAPLTLNSAKTSGSDGWSFMIGEGNNVNVLFGSTVTMNCSGTLQSNFRVVQGTGATATYNGDLTLNLTNTNASTQYQMGATGTSTFNGNIIVSNNGGASGIYFNGGATASSTLANTKTITVGAGGFNSGVLSLVRFTQLGNTAQSLTLTGSGNLTYGPTSAFGGNVTSVSPTLLFNGCTFSGTTNCTKNGTSNDASAGNNIFTGVSVMNNSGSGYLMFGNTNHDQWLTDVTYNNAGSNIIHVAYGSANNTFGGNVTCNNTSTGNNNGIYICANTAATGSITGNLILNNNAASGTNNGIRVCEGGSTSFSVAGTTTITNTNANVANYIRFSNGAGSSTSFGGDVTATNNGTTASTNVIHFGYAGSSIFNGNIILNSTGGAGIAFGSNAGTSTQVNNKSINTGTYTGGPLYIRNFAQSSPATGNASNVSITGTNMLLTFNNALFYDNVTGSSQEITATGSTFNGTASLTKVSGNANDYFPGGNTFNGTTTITNQSTFILGMGNTTGDAYNGNVTFVQSNTGALKPSYNTNCTYAGNITVTSPAATAITFGSGGASGISTMNGSSAQSINITTGAVPVFTQFVMNHTGSGVTLNTRINISTSLNMSLGIINTTSANILNMNNASTTNIGNASSYINGPMNYDMAFSGARTLNFPIGKLADWRPAILGLTHSAATAYTYNSELFDAPAPTTWTFPATIDTVSGVHYWVINRYTTGTTTSVPATGLSGNQTITLYFDVNDKVYDGAHLSIVKNTSAAPTAWIDIGGTGGPASLGGIALAGSVTSTSSPSAFNSFSTFTLGSRIGVWNPLPIEMLYFTAKPVESRVELDWATATETDNDYFTIEKSKDGVNFEFLQKVNTEALNGNSSTTLNYKTYDLTPYSGINYYRLKQTDFNGNYKYTSIEQVAFDVKSFVSVFPNPATNNFFINVSADYDNAVLKIADALGREVLSQTVNASNVNAVNANSLVPGVYYATLENSTGTINKTKIIIQK